MKDCSTALEIEASRLPQLKGSHQPQYSQKVNMTLTELPTDVIVLIFPYLTACDFLSFTSCTKKFLSFRHEPTFWRLLTTRTFRVPSQPLLHSDGARWQWLYKSLLTQTHLYTWGNNERGNLGYGTCSASGYPHQFTHRVGVVADVQCG